MNNELIVQPKSLKLLLSADITKDKFTEVLGKKSAGFIASLLSVVNNNELLAKAEPKSILNAAMTAATLDLPINQNLGFAYIIPYNTKIKEKTINATGREITIEKYITVAQFQMGYKGFIQLAMRSGQFRTINVTDVREGEIAGENRLTGETAYEWIKQNRDSLPVVGYVAYMKLINGFEKSFYMTTEELKKHGIKYSQSAKKGFGLWNDDFDAMASKTVVKLLLSKYAPMTTQMQTAQLADQAIIKDENTFEYADNEKLLPEDIAAQKERERIIKHIAESKTISELSACEEYIIDEDTKEAYKSKKATLSKKSEPLNPVISKDETKNFDRREREKEEK